MSSQIENSEEVKKEKSAFKASHSNPKKDHYDIIVIGAGSGGLSVGLSMHKLGFNVLLIDKNDKAIGGECLNTGCVPSKALIHVSRIIHSARKSSEYGLSVEGKVDINKVKDYIKEKTNIIRAHENASYFENIGIDVALGTARFLSNDSVEVGNKIYSGTKIVIATGSSPRKLDVEGVELVKYYDNENIFDIDFIPEKLLLIGAGPIGAELGQAFSRLGSKVSVVHSDERILPKEDPLISDLLQKKLSEEGIRFYLNSKVIRFTSEKEAVIEHQDGKTEKLQFDAVLVGIGRELHFDSLEIENAGIEAKDGKIMVNKHLQATNKKVFLSGDIAGNLNFSHAAELHATLLLNNFLSPFKKKLSFENFPWVTFTDPEVATFGLNENQLKEKGIKYEKEILDFNEDDRAIVGDYQYGKLILFLEKSRIFPGNAKILGGSMIAPEAGEMTQELILANVAGLKSSKIFDKIYAYPTSGRVNKTLMINRYDKFLNPFLKRIIKLMYKF